MTAEEIGACIQRIRKLHRYTQRELAEKLDTHQSMVARWEKGQIYPREELVRKIAEIFKMTPEELLSTQGVRGPASPHSIDMELQALWSEVGNLSTKDREVLKSILEAMLVRSRVQEAVGIGSRRAS